MYYCIYHDRECCACGFTITPALSRCPECHAVLNWHHGTASNCIMCANKASIAIIEKDEIDKKGVLSERIYQTILNELTQYATINPDHKEAITQLKTPTEAYAQVKALCPSAIEVDLQDDPFVKALFEWLLLISNQDKTFLAAGSYLCSELMRLRYGHSIVNLSNKGMRVYKISQEDIDNLKKEVNANDITTKFYKSFFGENN
jgi:hypothetical protein